MSTPQVLLRAETKQLRDGQFILRGTHFYAPTQEAADLVAMRWASEVREGQGLQPLLNKDGGIPAGKPAAAPRKPAATAVKPKLGRYTRRDLRAES